MTQHYVHPEHVHQASFTASAANTAFDAPARDDDPFKQELEEAVEDADVSYLDTPESTLYTRQPRYIVEGDDAAVVVDPAGGEVVYALDPEDPGQPYEESVGDRDVARVAARYGDSREAAVADEEAVMERLADAYADVHENYTGGDFRELTDADPEPVDGPFYGLTPLETYEDEDESTEETNELHLGDMPA